MLYHKPLLKEQAMSAVENKQAIELFVEPKILFSTLQASLKKTDESLAKQFTDMEMEIQHIGSLMPTSPFTSCSSLQSHEDDLAFDQLSLSDQCEHEFRGRTSSLLLPQRSQMFSPNLHRKATTNRTLNKLTRPKSLTHLNSLCI